MNGRRHEKGKQEVSERLTPSHAECKGREKDRRQSGNRVVDQPRQTAVLAPLGKEHAPHYYH